MIYDHLNSHFLSPEGLLNVVLAYIQQEGHSFCTLGKRKGRKRRTSYNVNNENELWNTPWGIMLRDEELLDPDSWLSKRFRLRFRVAPSMFRYIVERCQDADIFGQTKIPYEFRILIALRVLGRGNCADDIFEISGIGQSTVNRVFHQFTSKFVAHFYDEFVSFPSDEKLKVVTKAYEDLGFPGACGSMDATHLRLNKCPEGLKQLATGKEGYPSLAYQAICTPNREILYCSTGYLGSYNDMTITANDPLCQDIANGLLNEVEYKLVDEDGIPRACKGGYLIVDGGYQEASWLMPPFSSGCSISEKRWSEWLESVRKDIECTFGILKVRFRLFLHALLFHKFEDINNAWKAAIILHNMLITYDGRDLAEWEKNLNWSYIDPNFDTLQEEEMDANYMQEMDDYFEAQSSRAIRLEAGARRNMTRRLEMTVDTTPFGFTFDSRNVFHQYEKRKQLVRHFNFNFKLGLVKWPRRSGTAARICMRIPKIDMRNYDRTRHALYVRNSNLLLKNIPDDLDPRVGEGLFSHLAYEKGDVVAQFVGEIMSRADYDAQALRDGTGGYCIALPRGRVLQSYEARWNKDCLASCANCASNCVNVLYNDNAVNNCKITVNSKDEVKLVSDKAYIPAHTELLWDYGGDFVYPRPLHLP